MKFNKSLVLVAIITIALLSNGVNTTNCKKTKETKEKSLKTDSNEPKTVAYVDIDEYLGVWYRQASIPTYFEKGCKNSSATYSLNDDGTIRVNNTCSRDGVWSSTIGKATPQDCTNSKLIVQFGQSPGGEYWIVRLGLYYEYAVISNSDRSYLWILSRDVKMSEYLYKKIVQDLKNDDYPVDKLVKAER